MQWLWSFRKRMPRQPWTGELLPRPTIHQQNWQIQSLLQEWTALHTLSKSRRSLPARGVIASAILSQKMFRPR